MVSKKTFWVSISRQVAIVVLGVVFPIAILIQAYHGANALSVGVGSKVSSQELIELFKTAKASISSNNDYPFISLMYAENANQITMINKQIMKVAVMQLGFAVISVGMMFVVLGVNDGGAAGTGEAVGLKFDFKTGSTGLAAIFLGAAMTASAGLLKNDYKTVPLPSYALDPYEAHRAESLRAFRVCKNLMSSEYEKCFSNAFEEIYSDVLQK